MLGVPNNLPDIFIEVDIKFYLMKRLLGYKAEGAEKHSRIQRLTVDETLKFNVGSTETPGKVISVKDVMNFITLGHHEGSAQQPNLHEDRREGRIQQAYREEVPTDRLGRDQRWKDPMT